MIHQQPEIGAQTQQLKVLEEQTSGHRCDLSLEGVAGKTYTLRLRENDLGLHLHAEGAEMGALDHGLRVVSVTFPDGKGYTSKAVSFSW